MMGTGDARADASLAPSLHVGIVGLGLIGGSFARAYRAAGAEVYAFDIDGDILEAARVDTIAGVLDDDALGKLDIVVLAAYPLACIAWLKEHAAALAAASDVPRGHRSRSSSIPPV